MMTTRTTERTLEYLRFLLLQERNIPKPWLKDAHTPPAMKYRGSILLCLRWDDVLYSCTRIIRFRDMKNEMLCIK